MLNVECRGSEEHGALFVVVLVHDNAEMEGSRSWDPVLVAATSY